MKKTCQCTNPEENGKCPATDVLEDGFCAYCSKHCQKTIDVNSEITKLANEQNVDMEKCNCGRPATATVIDGGEINAGGFKGSSIRRFCKACYCEYQEELSRADDKKRKAEETLEENKCAKCGRKPAYNKMTQVNNLGVMGSMETFKSIGYVCNSCVQLSDMETIFREKGGKLESKGGTKFDQNKSRMDLIPSQAEEEEGFVWGYGAWKYEEHNFRKGILYSRILGAAQRHLSAIKRGEDLDADFINCQSCKESKESGTWKCKMHSGRKHWANVRCCMGMLAVMEVEHPELDDRYKIQK